jgi:hypothetical protein
MVDETDEEISKLAILWHLGSSEPCQLHNVSQGYVRQGRNLRYLVEAINK